MRNTRNNRIPFLSDPNKLSSESELLLDEFELSDSIVPDDFLTDSGRASRLSNCIVDDFGKRYSCVHLGSCHEKPNCFRNGLLQENIDFHKLQFHPEDRITWCEEVFPDILRLIDSETASNPLDYSFIFNLRYIREDRSIIQYIHIGTVVFVEDKLLPDLKLKVFFETNHPQKNDNIVMTIYKYSAERGYLKTLTKRYGRTETHILTERELEVIKLCYKGLSSKMIAEELNLSIHTIKNHKRNSMEKTMTHNIVELIRICLRNKWL